ncbi:MAG: hypothetical protein VX100_15495 [Pseudomonadota bacterium]|nr:hypothetical protein [Pseudomonadota bacterium]
MNGIKAVLLKMKMDNGWRVIRAYVYLLLSIATLVAAYKGWFYYGSDHADWFGRSGAVVALWATMSEALLAAYGIGNISHGIGDLKTNNYINKHKPLIVIGQSLGALMIVVGTMIWAYGDLLFKLN